MQEPTFNTWTIIFLFAAMQGLFLSIVLLADKRGDKTANKILGLLILSFTVMLLYYVSFWTRYNLRFTIIEGFTWPMPLLFGPLVYLYVKKIKGKNLHMNELLHFLPFLFAFMYITPFIFSAVEEKKLLLESMRAGEIYTFYTYTSILVSNLSLIIYTILIFNLKREYKISRHNGLTNPRRRLNWFGRINWFFAGFAASYVSYYAVLFITGYYRQFDYLISFSMSAFIYMVGYTGYRQAEVFWEIEKEKVVHGKYKQSSLSANEMSLYLRDITLMMEQEKMFVNSDLRVYDLAKRLNTSSAYVSQTINQKTGKSFNDFVNSYRIREARRLLRHSGYQNEKIISIAYDVGFNSKASFNSSFKKFTGMSPSEYRNASPLVFPDSLN